jgi:ACS family glucarate transporter-like MFS transporter
MTKQPIMPLRYMMVLGTFLLSLLLYIDRACISAAKGAISDSLGFSDKQMGWVLSIFALGYALFQVPSGIAGDKFGPRKVLTAVVTLWSIFTAFTGIAWNYSSMLIVRFLFGAGEAGAFPNMARTIYSWMPVKERGITQGINFSGSRIGSAFALPVVAWMITEIGWRTSFYILGGIGMLWSAAWYAFFRDNPEDHPNISEAEKELILAERQEQSTEKASISASIVFSSKNVWIAMSQYFASNFTFFFTLTWLLPYVKETYNLGLQEAGWYASIPILCGALGNWFSGWLIDRIYKSGKWKMSRVIPAVMGFSLAALGLVFSVFMSEVEWAIFFLSIAVFGADMTLSPSWSLCIDIGKENSGAVSGTMNMAGNIGAFITALSFPYFVDWFGGVKPFFFIAASLCVMAIFLWFFVKPEKSLEEY